MRIDALDCMVSLSHAWLSVQYLLGDSYNNKERNN